MRWRNHVLVVVLLGLVAFGCNGSSPTSPSEPRRQDALSLLSLDPPAGSTLRAGEAAQITARVRYSFATAARGKIGVIAFPSPFGLPIFTDPFSFDLTGQEGEATLHLKIYFNLSEPQDLPRNSPVVVDLSLFPEGVNQTQVSAQAHYQLAP